MNWHKLKEPMINSRRIHYVTLGSKSQAVGVFICNKDIRRLRQSDSSKLRYAERRFEEWLKSRLICDPVFATAVHDGILYTEFPILSMDSTRIRWNTGNAVRKHPIRRQYAHPIHGEYEGRGFQDGGRHWLKLKQPVVWQDTYDCKITGIGSKASQGMIQLTHTATGDVIYVDENSI